MSEQIRGAIPISEWRGEMKKVSVFLLAASWLLGLCNCPSHGATNDVTEFVENLGKPFTKGNYANNVWDMIVFEGKIYFGHGNSSNLGVDQNAGPVPIIYYDPATGIFTNEDDYVAEDEQIDVFRILDGELHIPGHDPTSGALDRGNFYRYETNTWVRYWTVPDAIHAYDIYKFDGKMFAALGSQGTNSTFLYTTNRAPTRNDWTKFPVRARRYTLFEFDGKLYCAPLMSTYASYIDIQVAQYSTNGEVALRSNLHFGTLCPSNVYKTGGLKIHRPVNFSNKLVYVAGETVNDHQMTPYEGGLYIASALETNNVQVEYAGLSTNERPWDIIVKSNTLYVLLSEKLPVRPERYLIKVMATENLQSWTELFRFEQPTFARSFERDESAFYFGLGTCLGTNITKAYSWVSYTDELIADSGNILRLKLRATNGGASNVTAGFATLGGRVFVPFGDDPDVFIYWGPTDEGTNRFLWAHTNYLGARPSGNFSVIVSNVPANTTQYYRCYVTNSAAEDWSDSADDFFYLWYSLGFRETFEATPSMMAGALGPINLQHGWQAEPAGDVMVQDNVAFEGAQAVRLMEEFYRVKLLHDFNDLRTNIWMELYVKPVFAADIDFVPTNASTVFWVNNAGNIVAYDGTNRITFPDVSVEQNQWIRFAVHSDYNTKRWSLWYDKTRVAEDLEFYSNVQTGFNRMAIWGAGYADNVLIDEAGILMDLDGDNMPDAWEITHLGSMTNSDGGINEDRDNDGSPDFHEYLAGTDPNNILSVFAFTNIWATSDANAVIQWHSVSGKTYSISRSTNLLQGFSGFIASGIPAAPPVNVYTDTVDAVREAYYLISLDP